jgi:hypothetical protein
VDGFEERTIFYSQDLGYTTRPNDSPERAFLGECDSTSVTERDSACLGGLRKRKRLLLDESSPPLHNRPHVGKKDDRHLLSGVPGGPPRQETLGTFS